MFWVKQMQNIETLFPMCMVSVLAVFRIRTLVTQRYTNATTR